MTQTQVLNVICDVCKVNAVLFLSRNIGYMYLHGDVPNLTKDWGSKEKVSNPLFYLWFELYCSNNDKAIHVLHKTTASPNLKLNGSDQLNKTSPHRMGFVSGCMGIDVEVFVYDDPIVSPIFTIEGTVACQINCASFSLLVRNDHGSAIKLRGLSKKKRVNERWGHWNSINP